MKSWTLYVVVDDRDNFTMEMRGLPLFHTSRRDAEDLARKMTEESQVGFPGYRRKATYRAQRLVVQPE